MTKWKVVKRRSKGIGTKSLVAVIVAIAALGTAGCSKTESSKQSVVETQETTEEEQSLTEQEIAEETKELTTTEMTEEEASTQLNEQADAKEQVAKEQKGTGKMQIKNKEPEKQEENKEVVNIVEQKVAEAEKPQVPQVSNPSKSENENPSSGSSSSTEENNTTGNQTKPQLESAYKLVWEDGFEGDELNRDDWNVELHEPGWVNQEWQEYVDSDENIYVKDGNLIIQAIKTTKDGKDYYTSGRVNTQNKHDFKYGRFEARAKVPSGKGFLPAFWMMPTDESFYGQWPKCGEIDIMEVLGDNTKTAHGTLHFGEPHTQRQGTYKLTKGDFSSEYHVYACEWEPGEIRFYVDDVLYFTEKDWFTKRNGFGEVAYPAPYDQPFYMILNVAVGGSWVGYPDETTQFDENARLVVDYVKVYQKDEYDENVTKPEKEVVLRDPDETGNYLNNADFSTNESLENGQDWQFLTTLGGVGNAKITDGKLEISTEKEGTADYSIQVVQADVPLEKGWKYRLSFDAYAKEARTMITSVTAPDLNYSRYFADTKLNLSTEAQKFEYEFDMTSESDANGRVEFNLGNQKSTATVFIDNVRVEKVEKITIKDEEKSVLPDGNYIYNSSFNEGSDRLNYWEIDNRCEGAKAYVTNDNLKREFKVQVPETVTALDEVILKQSPVALSGGKTYKFTVDAYGTEEKEIEAKIAGQTFVIPVKKNKETYTFVFNTEDSLKTTDLEFLLGTAGTTYLNNVRIQEDGMIVNGDFVNGTVGYEIYINESAKVSYGVDELKENAAMGFTIEDTGDQDWMIQLKQNNIKLEEGKWYKITFTAKSDLDRTIMYALQRDGSNDDNWIPYSGTQKIQVNSEYQTYEHVFKMKNDTDEKTILSISMGAVNGERITEKHTVFIDNITLEETEEPQIPETPKGDGLIQNGDFSNGTDKWENAITAPGKATVTYEDSKAIYRIENVGEQEWHIQLKQSGITLEKGKNYELSLKLKSDEARTVKAALLTETYDWYGGADIDLAKEQLKEVTVPLYIDKETDTNITFVLSMGVIAGKDTPASTIEIDDISLKEVSTASYKIEKKEEKEVVEEQSETASETGEAVTETEDTTEENSTEEITEETSETEESIENIKKIDSKVEEETEENSETEQNL